VRVPPRDRNADIVRAAFLAINRGDEEAFLDLLADDVEWRSATVGLLPATVMHGRDAVRRGRHEAEAEGRHVRTTLQELRTNGTDVLVLGVVTSERPHRGRVMLPLAWIWTLRDGRAVRVESFTGRQSALTAWHARGGA
jgi:ketosteroid isomerase-like protein